MKQFVFFLLAIFFSSSCHCHDTKKSRLPHIELAESNLKKTHEYFSSKTNRDSSCQPEFLEEPWGNLEKIILNVEAEDIYYVALDEESSKKVKILSFSTKNNLHEFNFYFELDENYKCVKFNVFKVLS